MIKPEIIDTIELITTAQESCIYLLNIENPLNKSITYSGNCQHQDINIEGLPKTIQPRTKVNFL